MMWAKVWSFLRYGLGQCQVFVRIGLCRRIRIGICRRIWVGVGCKTWVGIYFNYTIS